MEGTFCREVLKQMPHTRERRWSQKPESNAARRGILARTVVSRGEEKSPGIQKLPKEVLALQLLLC